jgi:hypothetical protein
MAIQRTFYCNDLEYPLHEILHRVCVVRNMFETASKLSFSLLELLKISLKFQFSFIIIKGKPVYDNIGIIFSVYRYRNIPSLHLQILL